MVKIKRLSERFPEHRWRYNVIYALSNAPYLPDIALRLAKLSRVPIAHNQNGVFYPAWYSGDWRAQNARMSRTYHCADHVFYQSEFCKRAAERFLGRRNGPSEILYNAVDTQRFHPGKRLPLAHDGSMTYLVTGRLDSHLFYRLESTLRGLALARQHGLDARLAIAGSADLTAQAMTHRLIDELKLNGHVTMSGPYSQDEAPALYAAADGYVTTKHQDPCPNAVLEALACGLPVLHTDSGGVPELVGPDAGVALPSVEDWEAPHAPEPAMVADGMMRLAVDRDRMAAAARERAVAKFDIGPWLDRHAAVFRNLLESSA